MQLGFANAHYKITPTRKKERGRRLGKFPKMWDFLLIFLQWL